MRTLFCSLLAAFALVCNSTNLHAEPHLVWPDDAEGNGIRESATAFLNCMASDDAAGAKKLFAGTDDQWQLVLMEMKWTDAAVTLRAKLIQHFGDSPSWGKQNSQELLRVRAAQTKQRLIIMNGDLGSVWGSGLTDCGMSFHRDGDVWNVTQIVPARAEFRVIWQYVQQMQDSVTRMTGDLDAGKITTTHEAEDRVKDAIDENIKLFNGPLVKLPPEPTSQPIAVVNLSPSELTALIGQKLKSPAFAGVLASLPGLPRIVGRDSVVMTSEEGGISFWFDGKTGLLQSINCYASGEAGANKYLGKLPFKLTMDDTRGEVESKLGLPPESMSEIFEYTATYPTLGVSIEYFGPAYRMTVKIRRVTFRKPDSDGLPPVTAAEGSKIPHLCFRLVANADDPPNSAFDLLDDADHKGRTVPVMRQVLMDERSIARVYMTTLNPDSKQEGIGMEMTDAGAEKFKEITTANPNRRLALVLDGKILSAPIIHGVITRFLTFDCGTSTVGEIGHLCGRIDAAVNSSARIAATQPALK
jgi:hypothetical protein